MCINIEKAKIKDLEEILALQYLAYQSEAKLVNDYSIQPLIETIEEIIDELDLRLIRMMNYVE